MSIVFKCDGISMGAVKKELADARVSMMKAYFAGLKLQEEIKGKQYWTGKTQMVAEAFLDILIQYQTALHGPDAPQAEAIEALNELDKNLEDYYESWKEYQDLEARKL